MRFEEGMTVDHYEPFGDDGVSAHVLNTLMTDLSLSSYALSSTVLQAIEPALPTEPDVVPEATPAESAPSVFSKFVTPQNDEEEKDTSLEKMEEVVLDRDDGDLDGDAEQKVEAQAVEQPVIEEAVAPAAPKIFQQEPVAQQPVAQQPEDTPEDSIEIEQVLQPEAQDNHVFMNYAIEHGIDLIRDFSFEDGDILNFANILGQYDPSQHVIEQFVLSREVEGGTIVSIDPSGTADSAKAIDLVALENINNLNLQELYESGHISLF